MNKKPTLLIVEDDPLNLIVYQHVLLNDFAVTLCRNESEFYKSLNENHYKLVIMDLSLGKGKDGIELIKELRQMEEYKLIPILAVTANVLKRDEELTMESGATLFIHKPFDNTFLVSMCKKYLLVE